MMRGLSAIVLGAIVCLLPVTMLAGEDPKKEFVNSLKGQIVALKLDAYTVHYVSAKGGTQTMRSRVQGILTVSPGRDEPYYHGEFVGLGTFTDANQQNLADKVGMKMASGSGNWFSGDPTATRSTAGARLMKYDRQTKMKIKDVRFDNDLVIIELWDEFTTKGEATTAINIKMPATISKEFIERQQVEGLLRQLLVLPGVNATSPQI